MESLKQHYSQRVEVTFAGCAPCDIDTVNGTTLLERNGSVVTLHVDRDINPLLGFLSCHDVERMEIRPPELQEVFLSYYQQEDTPSETTGEARR